MGTAGSSVNARGQRCQRVFPAAGARSATGGFKTYAQFAAGVIATDTNPGRRRFDDVARRAPSRAVGFYGKRRDSSSRTADRATGKLSQYSAWSESRGYTAGTNTHRATPAS